MGGALALALRAIAGAWFYQLCFSSTSYALQRRGLGVGRDAALKLGSSDISIEPSLGLGMINSPAEWFQNEEFRLKAVWHLEHEPFLAQRRQVLDASPERSLLIIREVGHDRLSLIANSMGAQVVVDALRTLHRVLTRGR